MNIEAARSVILSELKTSKTTTPNQISQNTMVPLIQVYNVMKQLEDLKVVKTVIEDKGRTYTVITPEKLNEKIFQVPVKPTITKNPVKPSPVEKEIKIKTGRDTTKYIFRKTAYSKGLCAWQVVQAYIKEKNPTYEKLVQIFPHEIVQRFGIVRTVDEAKALCTDGRPRYYSTKPEQILRTADNFDVVVTTQWTLDRFINFIVIADKLGYQIKAEQSN